MKKKSSLAALAVVALLQINCTELVQAQGTNDTRSSFHQRAEEVVTNAWEKTKETTTNAWADVKRGTTNAWSDFKESIQPASNYTYDKKNAFVSKARSDLDALDEKIKELSDKAATASESVKTNAQPKIQELRDKRAALDTNLVEVRASVETNWNEVKVGFKKSYDGTKASVKEAWQWLNDKMSQ
jgi:hypothetical protein